MPGHGAGDGVIEGQRALCDRVAATAQHDVARTCGTGPETLDAPAMSGIDTALMAPLENGMNRNEPTGLEDMDLVGEGMHLDQASPCGIWYAVALPPTLTMPSREMRRSSRNTARKGARGRGWRWDRSSAKASLTIRPIVAWQRGLATVSSQWRSWALRSSRLRNERAMKKSSRI